MKGNTVLIAGAALAVVAIVMAWPMVRIAWIRSKAGHIEEGGTIYDPDTLSYYDTRTGALRWSPSMPAKMA